MSHLSAIGFTMSLEEFQQLVMRAAQEGACLTSLRGYYLHWAPGAGVELWVQSNRQRHIVGCNPHFAGQGRLPASIIETVSASGRPLDGRCFGYAAPREPRNPYSGLHILAADLPDFDFVDERILIPPVVTLQIAAFARELACFPTENAFLESDIGRQYGAQPGRPVWKQQETGGVPEPEAFLSGWVMQSERRENPVTGQGFHWLLLRTEAGTVDVVADTETVPRRPVMGTVVAGNFWLSGRVVSELPPPKKQPTFRRARTSAGIE